MFLIQADGVAYNNVKNPAAVYDARDSVLLKIGEWDDMKNYYELLQYQYRMHGFHDIAYDIHLMELPKDQEEIDKVFGICDYIGKLHKKMITN